MAKSYDRLPTQTSAFEAMSDAEKIGRIVVSGGLSSEIGNEMRYARRFGGSRGLEPRFGLR